MFCRKCQKIQRKKVILRAKMRRLRRRYEFSVVVDFIWFSNKCDCLFFVILFKKKAEKGKKRPNESATKTPVPSKKIKSVTPQKTGVFSYTLSANHFPDVYIVFYYFWHYACICNSENTILLCSIFLVIKVLNFWIFIFATLTCSHWII